MNMQNLGMFINNPETKCYKRTKHHQIKTCITVLIIIVNVWYKKINFCPFFKKPFMILSSNIIVAGNKKQGALIAKKNTYCPVQITPPLPQTYTQKKYLLKQSHVQPNSYLTTIFPETRKHYYICIFVYHRNQPPTRNGFPAAVYFVKKNHYRYHKKLNRYWPLPFSETVK